MPLQNLEHERYSRGAMICFDFFLPRQCAMTRMPDYFRRNLRSWASSIWCLAGLLCNEKFAWLWLRLARGCTFRFQDSEEISSEPILPKIAWAPRTNCLNSFARYACMHMHAPLPVLFAQGIITPRHMHLRNAPRYATPASASVHRISVKRRRSHRYPCFFVFCLARVRQVVLRQLSNIV